MKLITGKHLSRRAFIGRMGAGVALPFLSAMLPAGRAWGQNSGGETPTRLVCIEESMGCAGGSDWGHARNLFAPEEVGRNFTLGTDNQLKPLEAYQDYLTIVSSTDCHMADPFNADQIGGDHRAQGVDHAQTDRHAEQGERGRGLLAIHERHEGTPRLHRAPFRAPSSRR